MTVIEAYRLLIIEVPQVSKGSDGKRANGRRLLRNWMNISSAESRQPILANMGEPAKSLIEAELASGRLS